MSTTIVPPKPPSMPPPPPPGGKATATPKAAPDPSEGGIPAYGTLIQVLSSSPGATPETYATIEGVGDITGPTNSMAEVDVTSHSTGIPIKQTIPGLIDLGDLSFPCYWNPQDPTQAYDSPYGMEFLFFNRIVTKFQLIIPDQTHLTRQFRGFVKTMGEDYKVAGVCTRNIAIRITSPLLHVASAVNLTPATATVTAAGSPTGTFSVKAGGSNAPWLAVPSDPWITVSAPTDQQQGDGDVTYAVAANATGTSRQGQITIAGLNLIFAISQAAT